jgi:putative ABC transport system substrate-binding protein
MTTRRQLLLASAVSAIAPEVAFAQARPVKVGMLSSRALNESFFASGVVRRLAELGYRQDAGMVLEFRSPSALDQYPKLAAELAALRCDLIFAVGSEYAPRAFRDAASRAPLVFLAVDYDPMEKGIIASLARPGGNVTGVYIPQAALAAKRIQIMGEVVPRARRFLVFVDRFSSSQLDPVRKASEPAGAQLTIIEFSKRPYDFEAAFAEGSKAKVEGFIQLASPVLASNGRRLSALLLKYRLPGAGASVGDAEAGFLFSYGADQDKVARRTAEIGARILKGAKPAEIPVEQADEFELVINAKTAAALGLKIPESVLARATRIVQ